MGWRKRYRVTIEDESRIENIFRISAPAVKIALSLFSIILLLIITGGLLMVLTPIKKALPGYLNKDERVAAEEKLMILDSLMLRLSENEAYLNALATTLDTDREVTPSTRKNIGEDRTYNDTLMPITPEEETFIESMREREKYNLSYIVPSAAGSMLFTPVNEESIFSTDSKNDYSAEIILAKGSTISAIADGTVIAINKSIGTEGNSLIVQHSKGFISRYSGLGKILADVGERIRGGQIIAFSAPSSSYYQNKIILEMWHDGIPLKPAEYINADSPSTHIPIIDEEVGRGRF